MSNGSRINIKTLTSQQKSFLHEWIAKNASPSRIAIEFNQHKYAALTSPEPLTMTLSPWLRIATNPKLTLLFLTVASHLSSSREPPGNKYNNGILCLETAISPLQTNIPRLQTTQRAASARATVRLCPKELRLKATTGRSQTPTRSPMRGRRADRYLEQHALRRSRGPASGGEWEIILHMTGVREEEAR